ncbi:MAG TPA: DUF2085 domain-containing protein [Ktedonobacterales bacterium]|nr:DUF2085 domain-containing protein [Ktedonobacterales bacterium]
MTDTLKGQSPEDGRTSPDDTGRDSHDLARPNMSGVLTGTDIVAVSTSRQKAISRFIERALGASVDGLTRFGRHWLLTLNVILGAIVGLAILTPILFILGQNSIASSLFALYHYICAQVPSHSYYLGGYQLALCARNLAIYSSLFAGTLIFRFVRDRLPVLGWRLWLLTMVPMALDGFTQMFGLRESNWELRTLTGVIFGLGLCWCLLPQIEEAAWSETSSAPEPRRPRIELTFGVIRHVFMGQPGQPEQASA